MTASARSASKVSTIDSKINTATAVRDKSGQVIRQTWLPGGLDFGTPGAPLQYTPGNLLYSASGFITSTSYEADNQGGIRFRDSARDPRDRLRQRYQDRLQLFATAALAEPGQDHQFGRRGADGHDLHARRRRPHHGHRRRALDHPRGGHRR